LGKGCDHNTFIPRKRLYSVKEGAEYLGRPVYSLRMLIYQGLLPVVKDRPGSRKMYLDLFDLEKFVNERKNHEI